MRKAYILSLGLWLSSLGLSAGLAIDCSIAPRPNDNYLEASFRFASLSKGSSPSAVVVYLPGTDGDGRGVVEDPAFLTMCKSCNADLVGCSYRGEGLSYDDPRGGSGRALDEALKYFAVKTGKAELSKAKLLLVGHSQGAIFAFNYVCWQPLRVKAFAALRAVFPSVSPKLETFQVPGLMAAGELDQPGRIRSIAVAFGEAAGKSAKWALLLEKQSGHDKGKSLRLTGLFFSAVCEGSSEGSFRLDMEGRNADDPLFQPSHSCWFPDRDTADFWRSINRPVSWENLVGLPDTPQLQDFVEVSRKPDRYACENGESQDGSVYVTSINPQIRVEQIRVTGEGFTLVETPEPTLPIELKICFAPQKMFWGQVRGDIVISGKLAGHHAESAHATLYAMVKGPLVPIPAVAYLGIVAPGQAIGQTILLKVSSPGIQLGSIQATDGLTANLGPPNSFGDLPLHIHWLGGSRLGRMEGQIILGVTAPTRGTLRIPVVGFVASLVPRTS